jgi:peptide deformylase
MRTGIVQVGDPVLRAVAKTMSAEEIRSPGTQDLIEVMRETMRAAPGVGLAAPQIGLSLQLAVIEDRTDYLEDIPAEKLVQLRRSPVDFHVIINPRLTIVGDSKVEYFEGCLSVAGFAAIVNRGESVRVECMNERAEPMTINAQGWYARILQHEIDHLNGTLYIDRMHTRSFTTVENVDLFWRNRSVEEVIKGLKISV